MALLSRELSRPAWIALSFSIIWCWKNLSLSCGSCVARHFLFRVIAGSPAFSWWYSEPIWIFVLVDLDFSFLGGAFFLLSIFSQDIPATWSVSALFWASNFVRAGNFIRNCNLAFHTTIACFTVEATHLQPNTKTLPSPSHEKYASFPAIMAKQFFNQSLSLQKALSRRN
jgi:hypothetical protein